MLLQKEVLIPVSISIRLLVSLPFGIGMACMAYMYRYYPLCLLTTWLIMVSGYRWKKAYTTDLVLCMAEHIFLFLVISRITMVDVYRFKWPYSVLWFVAVYIVMLMCMINEFLWYKQTKYYHLHPMNTEKIYTGYIYRKVCIHLLVSVSAMLGMSML